jgi:Tol biopolymer transport system component
MACTSTRSAEPAFTARGIAGLLALAFALSSCSNEPTSPSGVAASDDVAPSWSPVGDSIAFVHVALAGNDTTPDGVFVIASDGGGRRLVVAAPARSVDWSPDGQHLVFDSPAGLFTCTPFGGSLQQIVSGAAFSPSWSPVGDVIAYDDGSHIWTVDAAGGVPTPVVAGTDPDWTSDGAAMVILAQFFGTSGDELALISPAGALLRRLTTDDFQDRSPACSPVGPEIAWNRGPRGMSRRTPKFYVADTTGQPSRSLTFGQGDVAWSGDGTRLVMSIMTVVGSNLFTIHSDGTGLTQITR